jgi:hypothetical protein
MSENDNARAGTFAVSVYASQLFAVAMTAMSIEHLLFPEICIPCQGFSNPVTFENSSSALT